MAGHHGGALPPGQIALPLREPGSVRHTPHALYEELQRAVDRGLPRATQALLGRVHCYWCRSLECEHASPPEPRSTFGGYSPVGQPLWLEFATVALGRRHPRVEELFWSDPALIALVEPGSELTRAQLSVYGKSSPVYRILAQIAMGYISYPDGLFLERRGDMARASVAITLQAVDTGASIFLNIIGTLPDRSPVYQALEESRAASVQEALSTTRRHLEELALLRFGRKRRSSERGRRALLILERLSRTLERIFRQRQRRTAHAQDRHQSPDRPASAALRDALEASAEAIYRDVQEGTWVVIGRRSRVHVFNDAGLHVTSIVYPGETVRQRTTRGKWRVPPEADRAAFQEALRRRLGSG